MTAALPSEVGERAEADAKRKAAATRRLAVASRLATGMLANPKTYEMVGWESQVLIFAERMADRLIARCDPDGPQAG